MHILKQRIPVRVAQSGHDPLDGFFFLAMETKDLLQPGTIFEILNSSNGVIPFSLKTDGSVIMLTRLNVDWVMADHHVSPNLILPNDYVATKVEPAELYFMNGTTIEGIIEMDAAAGHQRTSDFLNGHDAFYPMLTRLGMLLVNKASVRMTKLAVTPSSQVAASAIGIAHLGRVRTRTLEDVARASASRPSA